MLSLEFLLLLQIPRFLEFVTLLWVRTTDRDLFVLEDFVGKLFSVFALLTFLSLEFLVKHMLLTLLVFFRRLVPLAFLEVLWILFLAVLDNEDVSLLVLFPLDAIFSLILLRLFPDKN